jgi:glycosyltransferase involved in cell wall biosynthesis
MIRTSDEVRAIFDKSPLRVNVFDKGRFDVTTIGTFYRLIKREKIDVMHLHCYGASTYGRIAGLLAGVPCIIHDYDTDFYFPYSWYLALCDRLLAPATAGAIAAAPLVREFMIKRRRIDRQKTRLMFHPVLPERYEPASRADVLAVRARLGIPGHSRIVGTLTKLAPERGNELLLDAAKEVLQVLPDTIFLFAYTPTEFHRLPQGYSPDTHTIGRDKNRAALEAQARALGIEKNIRFLETVDIPNAVAAACDLIAAPFLSERFSCARLLDAMAQGKPIIGTKLGEQREIISDGENGYLAEPDAGDLGKKIGVALSDPNRLAELGKGAKRVAQKYHVDSFVRELQDWYAALVQAADSRSSVSPPREFL